MWRRLIAMLSLVMCAPALAGPFDAPVSDPYADARLPTCAARCQISLEVFIDELAPAHIERIGKIRRAIAGRNAKIVAEKYYLVLSPRDRRQRRVVGMSGFNQWPAGLSIIPDFKGAVASGRGVTSMPAVYVSIDGRNATMRLDTFEKYFDK